MKRFLSLLTLTGFLLAGYGRPEPPDPGPHYKTVRASFPAHGS